MEFYKGKKLRHFGLIPDMAAQRYGDRTVFFFREKKQSFSEFSDRSSRFADALSKEGIKPGERVCLYIPNSIQFPEALFGIMKAGAIPVPLNLRMPHRILLSVVEDSGAETIVASHIETSISSPGKAKELAKDIGIDRLILPGETGEGTIDYSRLIQKGDSDFDYPPRKYDDFAVQYYTSGTTGKPKGVPLTHENLLTCVEGWSQMTGVEPDYRILLVLPLYHVYGLTAVWGTSLYKGSSVVFQAEPDPERILGNIVKYKCSFFTGVPALFRMMWMVYDQNPEEYDLSSLEQVVCAAAPLDELTRETIKREWKVGFMEGWGMTETSPAGALNPGYMPKGSGCIGWVIPNLEMKVVDPKTRDTIVPWNAIASWGGLKEEHVDREGELAVRGPPVFKGYYGMPKKNKEVFDEDGWFYTGDFVKIDKDKAVWMIERVDDMILSGGENIYPSMVEEALMEHPGITDAAVVGVPHKTKGEVPVAFIVTSDTDLTEEEIKDFSLERVPTYAHPRKVFFKNSLPKSGTLKIRHFKLEEEAKQRLPEPLG